MGSDVENVSDLLFIDHADIMTSIAMLIAVIVGDGANVLFVACVYRPSEAGNTLSLSLSGWEVAQRTPRTLLRCLVCRPAELEKLYRRHGVHPMPTGPRALWANIELQQLSVCARLH